MHGCLSPAYAFSPNKASQLLVSSSGLACVLINRETIATPPQLYTSRKIKPVARPDGKAYLKAPSAYLVSGAFHACVSCRAEPTAEAAQEGAAEEGGLRPDQMAKLDEASDEEMLEGGGIVLEDAAPRHISSVSETGAKAGNHAAAAALRARLHGGSRIPLSTHPSPCLTCSSLQRPPKACRGISILRDQHY